MLTFKEATDEVLTTFSHAELAGALRVSVPTVRQARLEDHARAHRSPPEGWESVVAQLAETRAKRLQGLAEKLQKAKKPHPKKI